MIYIYIFYIHIYIYYNVFNYQKVMSDPKMEGIEGIYSYKENASTFSGFKCYKK